jgi:hypothetical protein
MLRTTYSPTDVTSDVGGAMGRRGGGVGGGGMADYTGVMGDVLKRKLADMNIRRGYEAEDRRRAARERIEERDRQRNEASEARRLARAQRIREEKAEARALAEERETQPMKRVTVGMQSFLTPETQGLTARQRKNFLPSIAASS